MHSATIKVTIKLFSSASQKLMAFFTEICCKMCGKYNGLNNKQIQWKHMEQNIL